jgi:hypothetical protein
MSSALGCADDVEETPTAASEVTGGCTLVSSGAPWWNSSFPVETGSFHVEFQATPSANNIDAVVGLSNGTASTWTKLAAIVRFSPEGIIDVRRGNAYSYSSRNTYTAGVTYRIRLDVNVKTHTYSVYILNPGQLPVTLAKDFVFRSEQASVTSLNNIASYLEPSRAGSLNVCGISVVRDDSFGNSCLASDGGGTFQNAQLAPASSVLMAHFSATPSAANMDGVVGFAQGSVDAYNDFAASVRFYTNGRIEARDGDIYRADQPYAYEPGVKYWFHVVIDLPSKTYSVEVHRDGWSDVTEIAHSFKFRPQQAGVTALDHAATIVASTTGHVDACGLSNATWAGLKFAHRGNATVLPLHNTNLAMSDATETFITNADGVRLYGGAPAGVIANDNNDNIYVATTSFGWLTLQSFTSTLAPRYTRTYQVDGDPLSMNTWADGTVVVNVANQTLVMFRIDGTVATINLTQFTNPMVAISHFGWGLLQTFPENGIQIDSFMPNGDRIFQRYFSGRFSIEHFVPRTQAFVLTGQFYDPTNFGDGLMEPISNPETTENTFLLSINGNGALGFSERFFVSYSTGLATDDNSHIIVGLQNWTQFPYPSFAMFDGAGNALLGGPDDPTDYELEGFVGSVAVTSTGRALVNLGPRWTASAAEEPWQHVWAFEPL